MLCHFQRRIFEYALPIAQPLDSGLFYIGSVLLRTNEGTRRESVTIQANKHMGQKEGMYVTDCTKQMMGVLYSHEPSHLKGLLPFDKNVPQNMI